MRGGLGCQLMPLRPEARGWTALGQLSLRQPARLSDRQVPRAWGGALRDARCETLVSLTRSHKIR